MIRPRSVLRKVVNYVRHDLREIVFPSSLPDPPERQAKLKRKLTWKEHLWVWRMSVKLYAESWRGDSLSFLDDEKDKQKGKEKGQEEMEDAKREPTVVEEVVLAARLGAENVKPALQRIYLTRAKAYKDALGSFVQGYQEGVAEVMGEKDPKVEAQRTTRWENPQNSK